MTDTHNIQIHDDRQRQNCRRRQSRYITIVEGGKDDTLTYKYMTVSSIQIHDITIVEGDKVDTLTYKYMTVKHHKYRRRQNDTLTYKYMTVNHHNCRRRQRYSNIQIHDRQTSQL